MINYIKLKSYKGIESLELHDFGKINVICGKNNSGKSSILEGMADKKTFGIGKQVDGSVIQLFEPIANKFSTPSPDNSKKWFRTLIDILIYKNQIWYNSDIPELVRQIQQSMKQDDYLKQFQANVFDIDSLLNNFFETINNEYHPFLIPPKRSILFEKIINTDDPIKPEGEGILNKLFYLTNQDPNSIDYKTLISIENEFELITRHNFKIILKKGNNIQLYFNNAKGEWIPAQNCGLGLSDILVIIGMTKLTNYDTYLIEEPENHLHAEYQKKLLNFFTRQEAKQFVLATHSSIFLDPNIADKIFFTEFDGVVKVSDVTSRSYIISSLGYSVSDNLSSDLIVLTEGPTDVPIIESLLIWKGLNLKFNIKFWPLGGDIMNSLDLDVIAENHKVFAVIDSDPQSQSIRDEFKKRCKEFGIECHQLERYSIENYLSINAIKEIFLNQVPPNFNELVHDKSVKEQIGFNIKSKNYKIIKRMALRDFENTDLLQICNRIEEILTKNVT
jgi:AAA15 family ATPase/GTPase